MTVLATGIILYRLLPDGPRLLLLRNRDNGHWGFPKGRREDDDEHEVATALREVAEETGYAALRLDPDWRRELEYVVRGTSDDGRRKRVTYFLALAPAHEPALSPEHDAHDWADAAQADALLPFGQLRDLAREALTCAAARALAP